MPIVTLMIIGLIISSYYRFPEATVAFAMILTLIGPAYFKDIGQEKQTIKLTQDETMEKV